MIICRLVLMLALVMMVLVLQVDSAATVISGFSTTTAKPSLRAYLHGYPWLISTFTRYTPYNSWTISMAQLDWVLNTSSYIKHQYDLLIDNGVPPSSEWTSWTNCIECVLPHEKVFFQLRVQGSHESVELRACLPQSCFANTTYSGVAYKGCWIYASGQELTVEDKLHDGLVVQELNRATPDEALRSCAMIAANGDFIYLFIQKQMSTGLFNCILSKTTNPLKYGQSSECQSDGNNLYPMISGRASESTLAFYTLINCSASSIQTSVDGECGQLISANYVTEVNSWCEGPVSNYTQLMKFFQTTRNYWITYEGNFFYKNQTGANQCAIYDPFSNSLENIECSGSPLLALCAATPGVLSEETDWTPYSSCNSSCGPDGIKFRYRYSLEPSENITMDTPLERTTEAVACNTEYNCSLVTNANQENYRWLGCWKQLKTVFRLHESHPILDKLSSQRLKPVEKCTIASQGLATHIALQKNICYIANITSMSQITEFGPTVECPLHGDADGNDFQVYQINSVAQVPSQYGPWQDTSACTSACGAGTYERIRLCNNPPPLPHVVYDACADGLVHRERVSCLSRSCPANFDRMKIGCFTAPPHLAASLEPLESKLYTNTDYQVIDGPRKCALRAFYLGYKAAAYHGSGLCYISKDLECDYRQYEFSQDCLQRTGRRSNSIVIYKVINTADDSKPVCTTAPFSTQQLLDQELKLLENTGEITTEQALEILDTLNFYSQRDPTSQVISSTTDILEQVQMKLKIEGTTPAERQSVVEGLLQVVKQIMEPGNAPAVSQAGGFEDLITVTEELSVSLASYDGMSFSTPQSQSVELFIEDINVAAALASGLNRTYISTGIALNLPPEAFDSISVSMETVPMVVVTYMNVSSYVADEQGNLKLSRTLEAAVGEADSDELQTLRISDTVISVKLGDLQRCTTFSVPIEIVLPAPTQADEINNDTQVDKFCVFWSTSSPQGSWDAEGCATSVLSDGRVVCSCNHLTSFAVLIKFTDHKPPEDQSLALTIISYIGVATSLLFLLISFIIFLYLNNLKTERKKIHMNLIVALGLAQITHLVGINLTNDKTTCTCIAVLLHFLYLSTFTWMLCEGIHLYYKIISVFNSESSKKRILYYFIGWGCPVVIVAVSVGIRSDGYGNEEFCWLSIENGLIWAFIGPIVLVCLINFVIMTLVIRIVIKSATAMTDERRKTREVVKSGVKSVIILTPILGLNWLFGLLAINNYLTVFEFLFVIVNSFQGFLIFLFHCIGSSEVRVALRWKKEQSSRSKSLQENSVSQKGDRSKRRSPMKKKNNWFNIREGKSQMSAKTHPQQINTANTDIIAGLVEGTVGRNLGGLKHQVYLNADIHSTSEECEMNEELENSRNNNGYINRSYSREESVSMSVSMWCTNSVEIKSSDSSKSSPSTAMTNVSDNESSFKCSSGDVRSRASLNEFCEIENLDDDE